VLIFVFAAVATPDGRPVHDVRVRCPLTVLYFARGFCWLLDRRKEKARPDWLDVDDNQASAALRTQNFRCTQILLRAI
jgi:sec-independent protein translocase protein TatC